MPSLYNGGSPYAGVAQWLEFQPSKLAMRVRFPSPAPIDFYSRVNRARNVSTGIS